MIDHGSINYGVQVQDLFRKSEEYVILEYQLQQQKTRDQVSGSKQ